VPQDETERDETAGEREAVLERREAALAARESAMSSRMEAADDILAAADQRDAEADERDAGADTREREVDRAQLLAKGDGYGNDLPARRGAALDREHAKGDRAASQDDRIALTEADEGSQA
jgi:uncharacterized protein (DUF3084 family)